MTRVALALLLPVLACAHSRAPVCARPPVVHELHYVERRPCAHQRRLPEPVAPMPEPVAPMLVGDAAIDGIRLSEWARKLELWRRWIGGRAVTDVDDITRENARHFVAMCDADVLAQWRHCGCEGCLYCDTVEMARAMRAMQSRTKTKETR